MKTEDFILFQEAAFTNKYLASQAKPSDPKELFRKLAQKLIDELHPETILDIGCDIGLLVEALRELGIQAWGIDQSAETIRQAKPDLLPYLSAAPLSGPLPRNFDLIVCLEIVAYFQPIETEKIIENVCRHTDDVLFSSTPFFHPDVINASVQPPAYWAGIFAKHGFYHDLDYQAETIAPWCMRFRKANMSLEEAVSIYETQLWHSRMGARAARTLGVETHLKLAEKERLFDHLGYINRTLNTALKTNERELANIYSSSSWRLVKFIQNIRLGLVPLNSRREVWIKKILGKK